MSKRKVLSCIFKKDSNNFVCFSNPRLYNDKRQKTVSYRLSDGMLRPSIALLRNGVNFAEFATGLSYQQKQSDDNFFETEVTEEKISIFFQSFYFVVFTGS